MALFIHSDVTVVRGEKKPAALPPSGVFLSGQLVYSDQVRLLAQ